MERVVDAVPSGSVFCDELGLPLETVVDCDVALALLQGLTDEPGLREVARLSIDDVLDRRNELVAALSVDCGAGA